MFDFGQDRIIALDIGSSKLTLAEFSIDRVRGPELTRYGVSEVGLDADDESDSSAYIVTTIREIMAEQGIKPAPLLMTLSGQSVFPKYVKLPPVAREKVLQIIEYEAEQNVPFPIHEVVWDYQLVGGFADDELNVMLVAAKTEIVTRLTDCVQAAGLEPDIVDVAPMALYNTVRYNYPDLQGCTMIVDIGARSTNLVFIEENRIFTRSIPAAGNTITQEIMKEFDLSFREADDLKKEHAFVAFGGVYAGPDNETADRVSKIVRNVITRLHAEVNRSINFYRSQQGGSPPALVLLTGGSSVIPHTDTFFREKLQVPVEHLNPFHNLSVGDMIEGERINGDMQLMGEVAGLALRRSLTCPVEINLMPPDLVKKKLFRTRQPFFALAAAGIVLILLCWLVYSRRMSTMSAGQLKEVTGRIATLKRADESVKKVVKKEAAARLKIDSIISVISRRSQWVEMLNAIHSCMLDSMWLTSIESIGSSGMLTQIKIGGRGFEDKLQAAIKRQKDVTPIEVFRDRLKKFGAFSDVKITGQPPLAAGEVQRMFEMTISLKNPIPTRTK